MKAAREEMGKEEYESKGGETPCLADNKKACVFTHVGILPSQPSHMIRATGPMQGYFKAAMPSQLACSLRHGLSGDEHTHEAPLR